MAQKRYNAITQKRNNKLGHCLIHSLTPRPLAPLNPSHGFTLLELVFTISIFCFLLALGGFFFWRGIARSALETAASVLKSDMILMQNHASAENNAYLMKFYSDHYFFGPEDEVLDRRKLSGGARISGTTFSRKIPGKDAVLLHPSGAPSAGGTVTLQNSFGEKKYVIISYYLGRIRMSDTPP